MAGTPKREDTIITEFVTQGESDLFDWINSSEPHTVLGKEGVHTGLKSWWFCLEEGRFTRIGDEIQVLTTAELVAKYGSDIFWIESVPLEDLFEVEEEDEEEVASVN